MDGYAEALDFLAQYVKATRPHRRAAAGHHVERADAARVRAGSSSRTRSAASVFDKYGSREFSGIAYECDAHAGHHVVAEAIHRRGAAAKAAPPGPARWARSSSPISTTTACPSSATGSATSPRRWTRARSALHLRPRRAAHRRDRGARAVDHPGRRSGRYLPGTFFAHYLKEFDYAIKRFQVVQEQRGRHHASASSRAGAIRTTCSTEVLATFRKYLGDKMRIDVEFVDEVRSCGRASASRASRARAGLPTRCARRATDAGQRLPAAEDVAGRER